MAGREAGPVPSWPRGPTGPVAVPRTPCTRRMNRTIARTVLAALTLVTASCSSADKVDQELLRARIDVIETEIKARIGAALCTADSDCRGLPIGALACGGPSRFLPYSTQATDEGPLGRLSEDHRRLSAELVAAQGTVGPCVVLDPPIARCDRSAPLSCRFR